MDVMAATLPWVCMAIFVLVVVSVFVRSRKPVWIRDTWLMLNGQPRLALILAVVLIVTSLIAIVLGVVFLQVGFAFGWGFFPLGAAQLLVVGFYAWIARRPFDQDCSVS